MAVRAPVGRVYYYECSHGDFRLVLFMPRRELEQLAAENRVETQVLEDFPDGVDLDCTEPDFMKFHSLYGYRPERSPDLLRDAFYAIYSTTRDWEKFRGCGMIAAEELEKHLGQIEGKLKGQRTAPDYVAAPPQDFSPIERRKWQVQRAMQQRKLYEDLEALKVEGIDPNEFLSQQTFRSIEWEEGEDAAEVFSQLHQKGRL